MISFMKIFIGIKSDINLQKSERVDLCIIFFMCQHIVNPIYQMTLF